MKRGRKPKPAAIKLLQGNPGKRPIVEQEITPGIGPFQPPPFIELSEGGLAMWNYLSPILARLNLYTVLDVAALARYCEIWNEWDKARRFVAANGLGAPILKEGIDRQGRATTKVVGFVIYPQAKLFTKLDGALARKESEFGLTPAARMTVRAFAKEQQQTAYDQIDDLLQLDMDE